MKRRDLADYRREAEMLRIENMHLKREMNMLNAPVMNDSRFTPTPTPKVFFEKQRPRRPETIVKTIYISDGGFWRGFVIGALTISILWLLVSFALLRAGGMIL